LADSEGLRFPQSEPAGDPGPESFNSLSKWELIYRQGPWRGLDDVEFATLGYIDWFNHRRLHGEITDNNHYTNPAKFEAIYYRQEAPALEAVTQ
jgi:putative transposase